MAMKRRERAGVCRFIVTFSSFQESEGIAKRMNEREWLWCGINRVCLILVNMEEGQDF